VRPTLALLAVLCGCSNGPALEPAPPIPDRVETAGDRLLNLVPAGSSAIIEIDVHRLRSNAVVGGLVTAVAAQPDEPDRPELLRLLLGILQHSDAALIAVYDLGKDEARMLVLLRDLKAAGRGTAVKLDAHTHAMGPPELVERARELAGGAPRPSAAADNELLVLRARAMPEKATGAWLRATARLSFDARVELASRFGLDAVPQRVSVWADVADDLAIVALLGGDTEREAQQLGEQVRGSLQQVREAPAAARLLLSPVVRGLTVKVGGLVARTTVVIGPRALQAMVDSLLPMFERKDPPPSDPS
jgi:hypothetical protein